MQEGKPTPFGTSAPPGKTFGFSRCSKTDRSTSFGRESWRLAENWGRASSGGTCWGRGTLRKAGRPSVRTGREAVAKALLFRGARLLQPRTTQEYCGSPPAERGAGRE